MPLSVQVKVDLLIEKLFVSNCQFAKTLFSRTNFDGGACSLTMLSSHHWPGMTTAFLVLLLTEEGKLVCKDCFAFKDGKNAPEPGYDWDKAPLLNICQAYKPPIIIQEELDAQLYNSNSNIEIDNEDEDDDNWVYDTDDDDGDDFIIVKGERRRLRKRLLLCSAVIVSLWICFRRYLPFKPGADTVTLLLITICNKS